MSYSRGLRFQTLSISHPTTKKTPCKMLPILLLTSCQNHFIYNLSYTGFGNFNFRGDISDSRTSGLIGQSGFQIGLSANLNDHVDAILQMEEGVLRVDGITRDDSPKNFKSTINTFGLRFNYHLNSHKSKKLFNPFIGLGLSYLKIRFQGIQRRE